jgi:hypothetical protein
MIAVKSVLDTDTKYDVTVMFTEDWWDSPALGLVGSLGANVHVVRTPIINKTVCKGEWTFNKPWAGTYTAFNAWNMTEYDAVLYDTVRPSFSHGHTYVALSRVRQHDTIALFVSEESVGANAASISNFVFDNLLK